MNPFPEGTPASRILADIRAGGKPELGPGTPREGPWSAELDSLSDTDLLGTSHVADRSAAACVRSGLLLLGNHLEESHRLSQSIPTVEGSFWHGIMHRREPDYGNAKYWFRRVGNPPFLRQLARIAADRKGVAVEVIAGGSWDPFRMVDLVEACERGRRSEIRTDLTELQELEMLQLLAYCFRKAVGTGGDEDENQGP